MTLVLPLLMVVLGVSFVVVGVLPRPRRARGEVPPSVWTQELPDLRTSAGWYVADLDR